MHTLPPQSELLANALKFLLVEKRGTDLRISLDEGIEHLSVLWATTRVDGIPCFDPTIGWQFSTEDEDRGVVAVHLDTTGVFHVTSPDADLVYLTGKVQSAKDLETVLEILDSIDESNVEGVAIADQPLAAWLA